jgi:hypothetical protein
MFDVVRDDETTETEGINKPRKQVLREKRYTGGTYQMDEHFGAVPPR